MPIVSPNKPSSNKRKTLLQLCERGEWSKLLKRLSDGVTVAEVNRPDNDGLTPLHHACIEEGTEVARALLAAGADPLLGDSEGTAALHLAATCATAPRRLCTPALLLPTVHSVLPPDCTVQIPASPLEQVWQHRAGQHPPRAGSHTRSAHIGEQAVVGRWARRLSL